MRTTAGHTATRHTATRHTATRHTATGHTATRHTATRHTATRHTTTKRGGLIASLKGGISLLATAFLAAALFPAASAPLAQTTDTRPVWIRSADDGGEDEGESAVETAEGKTEGEAPSISPSPSESSASSESPTSSAPSPGAAEKGLRVASFSGPAKAYVGEPVTYRVLLEREGMDSLLSYRWQFGDGRSPTQPDESSPDADTAPSLRMISTHLNGQSKVASTHVYEEPGVYPVTFYVTSSAAENGPEEESRRMAKSQATITVTERDSDSPEEVRDAPVASTENGQPGAATRSEVTARLERAERAGKWGIVVASLQSARKADVAADQYRRQLEAEPVSVEVMSTELEEDRRFRVVVGTFENGEAARDAIATHRDKLPVRAWTVRFQDRFLSESGI